MVKLPKCFITVTSFSKILAAVLFISLPFLFFVSGLNIGTSLQLPFLQKEDPVVVFNPVVENNKSTKTVKDPNVLTPISSENSSVVIVNNQTLQGKIPTTNGQLEFTMPSKANRSIRTISGLSYGIDEKYGDVNVSTYRKDPKFNLDGYVEKQTEEGTYNELVNTSEIVIKSLVHDPVNYNPYNPKYIAGPDEKAKMVELNDLISYGKQWIIETKNDVIIISVYAGCESGECPSPSEKEIEELLDAKDQILKTMVLRYY